MSTEYKRPVSAHNFFIRGCASGMISSRCWLLVARWRIPTKKKWFIWLYFFSSCKPSHFSITIIGTSRSSKPTWLSVFQSGRSSCTRQQTADRHVALSYCPVDKSMGSMISTSCFSWKSLDRKVTRIKKDSKSLRFTTDWNDSYWSSLGSYELERVSDGWRWIRFFSGQKPRPLFFLEFIIFSS